MTIRASKKYGSEVYLQEPVSKDKEGNEISIIDIISTTADEVYDQVDFNLQLKSLYENMKTILKDREKTVLQLRYGLANGRETTQREIGEMMGISRSYSPDILGIKFKDKSANKKTAIFFTAVLFFIFLYPAPLL